mmetsp:Transcript_42334/g.110221  ORF Transcript_42334/g.110221 Transcript_42334/m.110221 type:complete len:275 (+) Transcript_42334:593-1417(+)
MSCTARCSSWHLRSICSASARCASPTALALRWSSSSLSWLAWRQARSCAALARLLFVFLCSSTASSSRLSAPCSCPSAASARRARSRSSAASACRLASASCVSCLCCFSCPDISRARSLVWSSSSLCLWAWAMVWTSCHTRSNFCWMASVPHSRLDGSLSTGTGTTLARGSVLDGSVTTLGCAMLGPRGAFRPGDAWARAAPRSAEGRRAAGCDTSAVRAEVAVEHRDTLCRLWVLCVPAGAGPRGCSAGAQAAFTGTCDGGGGAGARHCGGGL